MLRRFALAALLAAVPASVASAQPSTASDTADRPGFADSTQVIGRGRLQLESGIQFDHIRVDPGTERALTVPQWQFRTGLSSRVELSLWWEGFVHVSTDDRGQTAETDPRVGGKVQLVDRQAVALALIAGRGPQSPSRRSAATSTVPDSPSDEVNGALQAMRSSGSGSPVERRRLATGRPTEPISASATA